MLRFYTEPDTWSGGFYELAMEFPGRSEERLLGALEALWCAPDVEGCYLDRTIEPHEQVRCAVASPLLEHGHVYGLATLPSGQRVACGTYLMRECEGSDWLGFYVPMGALGRMLPVGGYPFEHHGDERWRGPIDEWLAMLGRLVWCRVPFELGVIGFEVGGEVNALELQARGVASERHDAHLLRNGAVLEYHPRTEQG